MISFTELSLERENESPPEECTPVAPLRIPVHQSPVSSRETSRARPEDVCVDFDSVEDICRELADFRRSMRSVMNQHLQMHERIVARLLKRHQSPSTEARCMCPAETI